MVYDDGVQVLDMQLRPEDADSRGLVLTTVNERSGFTRGTDFPNGAYWRVTFRDTRETEDGNQIGSLVMGPAWWTWSDSAEVGNSPSWLEMDFLEEGVHAGDDSGIGTWNPQYQGFGVSGWGDYFLIDHSVYHTIGGLVWQNPPSAHVSMCIYIDDVLQVHHGNPWGEPDGSPKCGTLTANDSQLNQRNFAILQIGLQQPIRVNEDLLVKDVQIWTCADWRGPLATPGHACPTK